MLIGLLIHNKWKSVQSSFDCALIHKWEQTGELKQVKQVFCILLLSIVFIWQLTFPNFNECSFVSVFLWTWISPFVMIEPDECVCGNQHPFDTFYLKSFKSCVIHKIIFNRPFNNKLIISLFCLSNWN